MKKSVEALDHAQQALVASLRCDRSYVDVHEDAQLAVAVILEDFILSGLGYYFLQSKGL